VTLYDTQLTVWPSPVVALNRTVALAEVHGPERALAEVVMLEQDGRLAAYQHLPAIKAELLHRLGRTAEAYRRALELTTNEVEREFLTRRLNGHDRA
jgi:RNA polymerase sigma-70 factor (ECF subfamily)